MMPLLWSTIVVVVTFVACVEAVGFCKAPILPTDLDLISSVEETDFRELHLHGMYRLGWDRYNSSTGRNEHILSLSPTAHGKSLFRVSVIVPTEVGIELKLELVEGDGRVVATSENPLGEKMIAATLSDSKKYKLVYSYSLGWSQRMLCPAVLMELALQPLKNVPSFTDSCEQAADNIVPELPNPLDPWDAKDLYYKFRMPEKASWVSFAHKGTSFARYPISVPRLTGHNTDRWKIKVGLQNRFLDAGAISAVIIFGKRQQLDLRLCNAIVEDEKAKPSSSSSGVAERAICFFGKRLLRNHFIIDQELFSGDYTLFLFLNQDKRKQTTDDDDSDATPGCAPYQLSIDLFPVKEQATFVSCDNDPLPDTFNAPGMYDETTGIMTFQEWILVNLTREFQTVTITPTKTSLMRARIGDHPLLDIDLLLFTSGGDMLAASQESTGPEGIVYPLKKGELYKLHVQIPSAIQGYSPETHHDFFAFCDSYQLSVHVFPISTSEEEEECEKELPNFSGLGKSLNDTSHSFSFDMTQLRENRFRFPLAKDWQVHQYVILQEHFYVPAPLSFAVFTVSDHFGGVVEIQLKRSDSIQRDYGVHTTVGCALKAELSPGWYDMLLLTPYAQRDSKSFSDLSNAFPLCVSFDVFVKIQPIADCNMKALSLMHEFPTAKHHHHHFYDEFLIPMPNGKHFMSIQPKVDSVFHLHLGVSDAPGIAYVAEGGAMSFSRSDAIAKTNEFGELIVKLNENSKYTVLFEFDVNAGGVSGSCRTFEPEFSLAPTRSNDGDECNKYSAVAVGGMQLGAVDLPYLPDEFPVQLRNENKIIFEVTQESYVKVQVEFWFPQLSVQINLCDVDEANCLKGQPSFNAKEIPTEKVKPGKYVIIITLDKSNPSHTCNYVTIQLGIVQVTSQSESEATGGSCQDEMLHYLPSTFNGVGMLWANYHDEFHFQQNLLVPVQHLRDVSTLKIHKTSILRIFVAQSQTVAVNVIVTSNGGNSALLSVQCPRHALYAELEPGTYTVTLVYLVGLEALNPNQCLTVPFEISVVTKQDISRFGKQSNDEDGDDSCSSPAFPTKPVFHGHDTLYRKVGTQFEKEIKFTFGPRGGNVEFDIRYGFEVGGLSVLLAKPFSGAYYDISSEWFYTADRAYLSKRLDEGQYSLMIKDPADNYYEHAAHAKCVAYSLHLRSEDYGGYNTGSSDNSDSHAASSTGAPTEEPTEIPDIKCIDIQYDELPPKLNQRSIQGSQFKIPFDKAEPFAIHTGTGEQRQLFAAVISTSFVVTGQSYVRVWARSQGIKKGTLVVTLFQTNSTERLAEGLFYGFHTQTLTYRPEDIAIVGKTELRLEIGFLFHHTPVFGEDYKDCTEKREVTTYELFLEVASPSAVSGAFTCHNDQDNSKLKAKRLPPTVIDVNDDGYTLENNNEFFFTQDDKQTRPPATSKYIVAESRRHSITFNLPKGKRLVSFVAHVRYNILSSDMRLTLLDPLDEQSEMATDPLATSSGGPISASDEEIHHMAEAIVMYQPNNGRDTNNHKLKSVILQIFQADAEDRSVTEESCIYFHLTLLVTVADDNSGDSSSGSASTATEKPKPMIIDVVPRQIEKQDPSKPLKIMFTLNVPAKPEFVRGKNFAMLYDDNDEDAKILGTTYFEDEVNVWVVFSSYTLGWGKSYTLHVDSSALMTKDDADMHYLTFLPKLHYSTSHCGCYTNERPDGVVESFCALGGACKCTLLDDTTCDKCDELSGYQLSKSTKTIGGKEYRVCEAGSKTPQKTTEEPTEEPQTQKPTTRKPRTPKPTKPSDSSSGTGSSSQGGITDTPVRPWTNEPAQTDAPLPFATTAPDASPSYRTLRYVLGYGLMGALAVYAISLLMQLKNSSASSRQRRIFANPFRGASRGAALGGRGGAIRHVEEEEEDFDEVDENRAIVGN